MGTLVGHLFMGIFLLSIGAWHLCRSMATYVRSPRDYAARVWHPVSCCSIAIAKHSELYILLAILPAGIIYELVASTDFQSLVKIGVAVYKIIDLQYAALLLGFTILALAALLADRAQFPQELGFFLVGSILFALEFMILSRPSDDDLEAKCDRILGILALVCCGSSGLLAAKPKLFMADLLLCGGIFLQGSWLLQTTFLLYVDAFIPQGCHRLLDLPRGIGSTKCELDEARTRAAALIDLAFILHVLVAIVVGFVLFFCSVARSHGRHGGTGYDSLSTLDGESSEVPMKPIVKQAQC